MMQDVHIAVTGASGFVGASVCAALIERGCTVSALSRTPGWGSEGVRVVHGGLADTEALDDLVEGAGAVIHAAGLVRSRDAPALRAANVDGLAALLGRCGGVDRFVHLSTAGVHGLPGGSVDEASRFRPANPYEASKAAAERVLFEARSSGAVAVRPTNILGPGHPLDPLARFLLSVVSGRVWTWSGAWANYVGVDAVAAAAVAAAVDSNAPRAVLVNDPRPISDLAAVAARVLGVPDRTHLLPAVLARATRPPLGLASRWIRSLDRVRGALDTTRFETAHAAWLRDVGVRVDLGPTLAGMVEDYRRRGLL